MERFVIDGRYETMLSYCGINVEEALRKAELPGDIFKHKTPVMTEEEYYCFLDVVGSMNSDPEMPIGIATANQIEAFSAPIFASYCSKNGLVCIERLARYKRLIGPMVMLIREDEDVVYIEFTTEDNVLKLPQFLVETEFVFLVNLIRKATKEAINPKFVHMIQPVEADALNTYFGVNVQKGYINQIAFLKTDLEKPFVSYDDSMWSYFEPELSKRLAELDVDESTSARVRSALTELLPGGVSNIDDVAKKLGMSKRTLQRKLAEENTTFQKQLNNTRELLAIHYIRNTNMTSNDIAFLLGYQELNSFLRAFSVWTGMSVSEYRKKVH